MIHKLFIGGLILSMMLGCSNAGKPSAQSANDTIKIGGSAETYDVLELLIDTYKTKTTGVEFEFLPPSQTSGGIQAIKSAVIDIGGVSRNILPEEIGAQAIYIPLVKSPLVIAVHDSVTGISNITSDQIKAIYSGQITNWQALGGPNAPINLFDFTEDENEKKVLRQAYLGDDLVITPNAIVFAEDDELVETAAVTEFSIAAIPYEEGLDRLPFTILSIDGIFPSSRNAQSGEYAMTLTLGFVLNQQPSTATQSFLEFAIGPEGKQVLTDTQYLLIEPN